MIKKLYTDSDYSTGYLAHKLNEIIDYINSGAEKQTDKCPSCGSVFLIEKVYPQGEEPFLQKLCKNCNYFVGFEKKIGTPTPYFREELRKELDNEIERHRNGFGAIQGVSGLALASDILNLPKMRELLNDRHISKNN